MMKSALIACCLTMTVASPLAAHKHEAAPAAIATPLWNGLNSGMSPAQVKALHLPRKVALADQCWANVSIDYQRDRLASITLKSSSHEKFGSHCGAMIGKSLDAKYGLPEADGLRILYGAGPLADDASPFRRMVKEGDLDRSTVQSWATDDKLILFKSRLKQADWSVTYVARPNSSATAIAHL
jgi:hypothetical protein